MTRNGKNYAKAKIEMVDKLNTGIELKLCEFEPGKVIGLDKETQGYEMEI